MLKETFELAVDGLKFIVTVEGDDKITVLKKRNEIFRYILGVPEVIQLSHDDMRQLEIDDLKRTWRSSN